MKMVHENGTRKWGHRKWRKWGENGENAKMENGKWGHILIIALNLFVKSKSKITLIKRDTRCDPIFPLKCDNQDVTPFPFPHI